VALTLGISEQTARARVSRGLRALTEALEPHPDTPKEAS
jgi:DNA-directed RNA polymerase specialized sigma24 family protein